MLQALLGDHPPAISGSAALVAIDHVIQRALSKAPAGRFASAAAMAAEVRRIADFPAEPLAVQVNRLKRIAVLPFRLLRPDLEIDFLGLGLADALGSSLADNEDVVVRSVLALPASALNTDDVQRAGTALDADFVLTGTLLRSGTRVRVSAQLVEVRSARAAWAQQIEGSLDDLFELQDSIASTIFPPCRS